MLCCVVLCCVALWCVVMCRVVLQGLPALEPEWHAGVEMIGCRVLC